MKGYCYACGKERYICLKKKTHKFGCMKCGSDKVLTLSQYKVHNNKNGGIKKNG